jgi:hypothetical protein
MNKGKWMSSPQTQDGYAMTEGVKAPRDRERPVVNGRS